MLQVHQAAYLADCLAAASSGAADCCSISFSFFSRKGRLAAAAQFAWCVTASFCTCAQRASASCALSGQIIERATIILQVEDTIALLEVEIRSVQLVTVAQPGGKVSLHQLRLPDLGFEVVECFGILRV